MDYVRLSKEIAYILRHKPWEYKLELDDAGFVDISLMLSRINERKKYSREITIEVS